MSAYCPMEIGRRIIAYCLRFPCVYEVDVVSEDGDAVQLCGVDLARFGFSRCLSAIFFNTSQDCLSPQTCLAAKLFSVRSEDLPRFSYDTSKLKTPKIT